MPSPPLQLTGAHRASMRRLTHLTDWASGQIARQSVGDESMGDLVLYIFTGVVIRLCRALVAEIRGGSTDRTSSCMRAMIEVLINARYVLSGETEERALAFIFDDVRSNLNRARRIQLTLRRGRAPSMSRLSSADEWQGHVTRLETELLALKQRYGDRTLAWPPLEQRARKGDSDELYAGPYSLFSEDEHLSARALDAYMEQQGDRVRFTFVPDLHLLDSYLTSAHVYLLALLDQCGKRLGFPAADELRRFGTAVDLLIPMAGESELDVQ